MTLRQQVVQDALLRAAHAVSVVLQAWGCVIGKDYPSPIVDHAEQLKKNLPRLKLAYASGNVAGIVAEKPAAKKLKTTA